MTALRGSGYPPESSRGIAWARLADARRRARAERRVRTGNGPRPTRGVRPAVWAAVPAGYQPARDLRRWLAAVTDAAYIAHRSDAAERRIELAWLLAKHTDWRTCTSRCGWALLADRGCVSRRTVARFVAWLRAENLLGVVSTGRTGVLTRPMALTSGPPAASGLGVSHAAAAAAGAGGTARAGGGSDNEAAVYVLTEPIPAPRAYQAPDPGLVGLDPRYATGELTVGVDGRASLETRRGPIAVDEVGTPNGSPLVTSQHAPARACDRCHRLLTTPLRGRNIGTSSQLATGQGRPTWHPDTHSHQGRHGPGKVPVLCPRCQATRWPRHTPAATKRDRLALCDRLRHDAPPLTWVGSTRRLRWLLADFLATGWTADDVLHALDTHPDTGPYAYATTAPGTPGGLRNPAGWLLHRLKPWRRPDGTPLPSWANRQTAAHAARAAAAAEETPPAAASGSPTGPNTAWRHARATTRTKPAHP